MKKSKWLLLLKTVGKFLGKLLIKKFFKRKEKWLTISDIPKMETPKTYTYSKPLPMITQSDLETAKIRRKRKRIVYIEKPRSMTPAEIEHYKKYKTLSNFKPMKKLSDDQHNTATGSGCLAYLFLFGLIYLLIFKTCKHNEAQKLRSYKVVSSIR